MSNTGTVPRPMPKMLAHVARDSSDAAKAKGAWLAMGPTTKLSGVPGQLPGSSTG